REALRRSNGLANALSGSHCAGWMPTKHLDAVVKRIRNDDRPIGAHPQALGGAKLPIAGASGGAAHGAEESTPRGKDLDTVVVPIQDDDCPIGSYGYRAIGEVELSIASAGAAKTEEKLPSRVKDLDALIVHICHNDPPIGANRNAVRVGELSIAGASA